MKLPDYDIFDEKGYTLIEVIMVILIIGILIAVATGQFLPKTETARFEATVAEMQGLAYAIAGDPEIRENGIRTDFGYVGDIGSLPSTLDALVSNPGYGTWNGPYLSSDFDNNGYKEDGWGDAYILTDTLLRSSGSGSNIDKLIAVSSQALLSNNIEGVILDAKTSPPGATYRDSIFVKLSYPDGSGSFAVDSVSPASDGYFNFTGIPIGNHTLTIVFVPDSDTIIRPVNISPGRDTRLEIIFPADLW